MVTVTGHIKDFTPANGSVTDSPPVDSTADAELTIPGFGSDPNPKSYRLTITITVFDFSTCVTSIGSIFRAIYKQAFMAKTWTVRRATAPLDEGRYLLTAMVESEEKKDDGTFEPAVLLDTQIHTVTIGDPAGCIPSVDFCSAVNDSVPGCTVPIPAPNEEVDEGLVGIQNKVYYRVTGDTGCTRKFQFHFKLHLTGPGHDNTLISEGTKPDSPIPAGTYSSVSLLGGVATLTPGTYTATTSVTVQRTNSTNPDCNQITKYGAYSWPFTVKGKPSSSSSSECSSSSSIGSSSSSSSFVNSFSSGGESSSSWMG